MDTSWVCRVDREWRRSMTWSLGWTHERGQGCVAESQSRTTIENGESPTSSRITLESLIGRESRSHLVVVALSRHEIAWLRPEKVQEGETLRRACGEARRKRNESCSRNRGPESRRSYHRVVRKTCAWVCTEDRPPMLPSDYHSGFYAVTWSRHFTLANSRPVKALHTRYR